MEPVITFAVLLQLATPISILASVIAFFLGLKSFLRGWKTENDIAHKDHCENTKQVKKNTFEIIENQEKQAIHQEYMRKIFDEFTRSTNRNNELIGHLTMVMEAIKEQLKKNQ